MMKKLIIPACFLIAALSSCRKNKEVLSDEVQVTVLHTTCVKTILQIDSPTTLGITWSNNTRPSFAAYQHVFEAAAMKNVPTSGLVEPGQYKVKIYSTATGPRATCYMLDPVNSPSVSYDIEFLP